MKLARATDVRSRRCWNRVLFEAHSQAAVMRWKIISEMFERVMMIE